MDILLKYPPHALLEESCLAALRLLRHEGEFRTVKKIRYTTNPENPESYRYEFYFAFRARKNGPEMLMRGICEPYGYAEIHVFTAPDQKEIISLGFIQEDRTYFRSLAIVQFDKFLKNYDESECESIRMPYSLAEGEEKVA